MPEAREHFLPVRRVDLERLLVDDAAIPADERQHLREFAAILTATIHDDYHTRLERLKDLYEPINPDRDTVAVPGAATSDQAAFITELEALLTRANYRRLPPDELNRALNEESVFAVKLHTQLDDFADLVIFHRGLKTRNEVVQRLLRRQKLVSVDYFSRVAIFTRFQDKAWFETPKRKKRKLPFTPGTAILKLFQNVPKADIEMLMPNAEVRMRLKDHLMLAVPAVVGGVGILAKFALAITMVWIVMLTWMGLRQDDPKNHAEQLGALIAFGIALAALTGFLLRQFGNFKNRKIRFMKELADNLYYRNLDNNAGVLHRLIDEAEEEDVKEALLAYLFLHRAGGPVSEADLDARIEAWFKDTLHLDLDFEVDDALDKLARFKLAVKDGDRWSAVPLAEAKRVLDERWDNKFSFSN